MKLLCDRVLKITKEQSKTNIKIPIVVDTNYEKLIIRYAYSPKYTFDEKICKIHILKAFDDYDITNKTWKEFMPIANLITISLDDENGEYLGCAHNPREENTYIISKDKSSYGFYPKKIGIGTYCVTLNVHLVFHNDVTYKLKVYGE